MRDHTNTLGSASLAAEDMWSVVNSDGNANWGIVGYESPKIYFDHRRKKTDKETLDLHSMVWSKKGHYPKPKVPVDKEGKPIILKKVNFIDDCIKQSNSNFSKDKFDKYVEFLKDKRAQTLDEVEGIKSLPQVKNIDKSKAKIHKHDRSTFIADIYTTEQNKKRYPPHIQELVDKTKERQERFATSYNEAKSKNKVKPSLSKADKLTFVSDTECLGERIPFYNTKPNEEGEKDDKAIKKNLFFPDKLKVMNRSPNWKIHKQVNIDKAYVEKREDLANSKVENQKKTWESRRLKFIDDVSLSYFQVEDGRKIKFKYTKPLEKSPQYATAKEQSPAKSPGPQQYFKTPIVVLRVSLKPGEEEKVKDQPEGSPKVYYSNRDRVDKKIYKPMRSYVF